PREDDSHPIGAYPGAEQFGSGSHLEWNEERRDAGDALSLETLEKRGPGEERFETSRRDAGHQDALDGRGGGSAARACLGGSAAPFGLDVRQVPPCGRDSLAR